MIIEHGGAAITRDNLVFLRDQIAALEKENETLKSDNQTPEFDKKDLTHKAEVLNSQLNEKDGIIKTLQTSLDQNKTPAYRPKPIGIIGKKQ